MTSITQVQQQLLSQMQQLAQAAGSEPVRASQTPPSGLGATFEAALRNVDAQQHQAGAAVAAVERGESDDLVGAMLDSQKASVSFSALLQVRNKLTTAFDDVMRMPL
ncbi:MULTISPECIES: flagellar hook-basal body complex protein FliE [Stutzerimonas]|jgi:flagellar hook-basal body complex protein FliE|uniref:flagellar hook-basal body complex protein FliE n=1 Tax=Stutzerimonas TaxID=2901164 RepID=UPI0007734E80|nr:flagellar hook-basal body complex protein FliE [Stutzerimonas balearica]WIX02950.1 flagellar hook-basal body complex protein FliE [Pseudomonas sp. AR5]MBD3738240.1 flagellar hook-basal body complex protein FliE [Stutzerimonas balearica]MBK3746372.1 flagellar hook-basal body protein FliE [Stutzerimonas balearica]MBK3824568.1 flagellar hook-basal body protein FliE [Stutzerimonas balearica]MBK3854259.1 flagellar hook-basal body protein FliE [Stutzerimonas balearica]